MWSLTPDISVPVLVLFTKFDALLGQAMTDLEEENCEVTLEALPARAMKIFEGYKLPSKFAESKYPPKSHVTMESECHCIIDDIELSSKQKCIQMETAQNCWKKLQRCLMMRLLRRCLLQHNRSV